MIYNDIQIVMDIIDRVCPACGTLFATRQAVHSHMAQKRRCLWYRKGKLREVRHNGGPNVASVLEDTDTNLPRLRKRRRRSKSPPHPRPSKRRQTSHSSNPHDCLDTLDMTCLDGDGYFAEEVDDGLEQLEEDINGPDLEIEDIVMNMPDDPMDNIFHFIDNVEPVVPEPEIGEAGPGPSTHAGGRFARGKRHVLEDDEEDKRVVEEDLADGKLIRMSDPLHDVWKAKFGEGEEGSDSDSNEDRLYAPFASELDWRIAAWMVHDSPGHNALDRLLSIPGVRDLTCLYDGILILPQVVEKLGLSFHNARALHQVVDKIPGQAGTWRETQLEFEDDQTGEVHIVRHRNPVEAVKCLWGDPELAKHLVYRPQKVFTDAEKSGRIYSELWTGDWWHGVQVCSSCQRRILLMARH